MIGAPISDRTRRIPDRFDDAIRREVARSRGLDNLTADAPFDVRIRANAAAVRGLTYIPPRNFTKGRIPRPPAPASYSGVRQTLSRMPERRSYS